MPRLVVVSNRVAPITEGEPTAGGLAAGVLDALKQKGGLWFGWSGEITDSADAPAHVERSVGPITLCTVDLARRDYDAYYRGFANVGFNGFAWTVSSKTWTTRISSRMERKKSRSIWSSTAW